jgi:hypothetical protein
VSKLNVRVVTCGFRSIARFRHRHLDALADLLVQSLHLAQKLGMERTPAVRLSPQPDEDYAGRCCVKPSRDLDAAAGFDLTRSSAASDLEDRLMQQRHWARVPIRICWRPGRGHWLLARRSIADGEIAYYVCYGPRRSTLVDLAVIAGSRWAIEELFQTAKNETGLDHYQVRRYDAWYAHITLPMAAHAWLVVAKTVAAKGEPAPART